jgi:hypothetical protein
MAMYLGRDQTVAVIPSGYARFNGESDLIKIDLEVPYIRVQLNVSEVPNPDAYLTVFIEDSLDQDNWHVVGQFPQIHRDSEKKIHVINIVRPFTNLMRVRWEITGDSPDPRFSFRVDCFVG